VFHQLLTPIDNSLGLSFLVAALPVLAVVLLLGKRLLGSWSA
jgi:lactate permease